MKQKKGMIILAAVLVVLVILYSALAVWNKKADEKEAKKTEEETVHLTDADNISAIKYTDGQSTMSFIKEEDTWYYEDDLEILLNQDVIEGIKDTISGLTAVRELEDPDDLKDYGLTEPAYTIWYTDGEETTPIYIGNMTGENYYATVGDTGKVYTITNSIISSLHFELSEIVENDTVPSIGSGNLTKVEVIQGAKTTEYTEEDDLAQLAGGFGTLTLDTCVNYHASNENLITYGLDKDNRITASASYADPDTEEEETFTVYIGKTDDSGGNQYVMKEDSKMVYQVSSAVIKNMTAVSEEETEE